LFEAQLDLGRVPIRIDTAATTCTLLRLNRAQHSDHTCAWRAREHRREGSIGNNALD
jgi:hypothetical protein